MKIALINGSPKVQGSASGSLLEDLQASFPAGAEPVGISLHRAAIEEDTLGKIQQADALVISCPLYVDGLPGHLLTCLMQMERQLREGVQVYGIVNCGFYEGIQAEPALHILENWCAKAGVIWAGGIGVGGGGGLGQMPSMENGPRAPIHKELRVLAEHIMQEKEMGERYVSVAFPRFLYRWAAQLGWRQMIKKNGGKISDLGKRW